jgi:hypothetical protein
MSKRNNIKKAYERYDEVVMENRSLKKQLESVRSKINEEIEWHNNLDKRGHLTKYGEGALNILKEIKSLIG